MKRMTAQEKEAYKATLMKILSRHIGKNNAISMADLYRRAFCREFEDKINGTRVLRRLITELRDEGVPICSSASQSCGGYYLAAAGSEAEEYCRALRSQALGMLRRECAIRRIAVPELLGQMQAEIQMGGE